MGSRGFLKTMKIYDKFKHMKITPPYQKYIYWLDPAASSEAVVELQKDKKRIFKAKQHPCEALYPRRNLVLIEPDAWDRRCSRQGAWYRASSRRGQSLLVSNDPLKQFTLWGTLTLETFTPPRIATDDEVLEILCDERLPAMLPEDWGSFSVWERQSIHQYLLQEGIERSLQEIFSYYTANHLNFLFPRFFVADSRHPVIPYSIQQTALVCSACVEIYGIIGEQYPEKYLVPCPGLKYIKPAPGQYLRVVNERPENEIS